MTILTLVFIGLLFVAGLSDLRYRIIPNWVVVAIMLAWMAKYAVAFAGSGFETELLRALSYDFAAALGVFLLFVLAFELGVLGGGDVKLIGASALYLGADMVLTFLWATAMIGAGLAFLFVPRYIRRRLRPELELSPDVLPYGVAIATSGIVLSIL